MEFFYSSLIIAKSQELSSVANTHQHNNGFMLKSAWIKRSLHSQNAQLFSARASETYAYIIGSKHKELNFHILIITFLLTTDIIMRTKCEAKFAIMIFKH